MERKIIWQPIAEEDLKRITEFLLWRWYEDVVDEFEFLIQKAMIGLLANPLKGRLLNPDRPIRRFVIHKRCIIFYSYYPHSETIEINGLMDTRQNPDRKRF